jgi:hypothetical protein
MDQYFSGLRGSVLSGLKKIDTLHGLKIVFYLKYPFQVIDGVQ